MKNIYVTFDENGGWVSKVQPSDSEDYLLNPSLVEVHGIPPEFWKRHGNSVIAMSSNEQSAQIERLADMPRPASAPKPKDQEMIKLMGPRGHKGDKGDRGPEGKQGSQGLKGPKGDMGERGQSGPQGPLCSEIHRKRSLKRDLVLMAVAIIISTILHFALR